MRAQEALFAEPAAFATSSEASHQLWSYLVENKSVADAPTLVDGRGEKRELRASIPLSLSGRYLLPDGCEFTCKAVEISPVGIFMRGVLGGRQGDWIVAEFRALGRIEGWMTRKHGVHFVLDVQANPIGLERLARKIGWQLRHQRGETQERRKHERVEQGRRHGRLTTDDGRELSGEVLDESRGGAAIQLGEAALYFWVGQPVGFNGRAARVLRYFPGGIVLKFEEPPEVDEADPR